MIRNAFVPLLLAGSLLGQESTSLESPTPLVEVMGSKLPKKLASFGFVRLGQYAYVYGGHSGRTHDFGPHSQTGEFLRLNLLDLRTVEALPADLPVQGTALAARGRKVFRIGGLRALRDHAGEVELRSTSSVRVFDTQSMKWEEETPLPEPRSSHDAHVIGHHVYVVGGWGLMNGEDFWHETAYRADLRRMPLVWEPIANPPSMRRAFALADCGGKLAAIGGIGADGDILKSVEIFDPDTGTWTAGPDLPSSGFGASAVTIDGILYASGLRTPLFALHPGADSFQEVSDYDTPRFFEGLIPLDDGRIAALAGVGSGDHMSTIEVLDPRGETAPRLVSWHLPYPGVAKSRQGLFVHQDAIWAFGGNNSTRQHAFAETNFVEESHVFHTATMSVSRRMADLPVHRQSMRTAIAGGRRDRVGFAAGGFGHDGDGERAFDEVFRYDFKANEWTADGSLLTPRTQFDLVSHDGSLWVFGGANFRAGKDADEEFRFPKSVIRRGLEQGSEWSDTGARIPTTRRAFGGAILDGQYWMLGGFGPGYDVVDQVDVFDFESKTWIEGPEPASTRVGAQVAVIDGRLYVGLGSSFDDEGDLSPNPSVEVYEPGKGWRTLVEKLPFPTFQCRMVAMNGRLTFFTTYYENGGRAFLAQLDPNLGALEVPGEAGGER